MPGREIARSPDRQIARGDLSNNQILILDYGSQFTQLIARRVREAHVYCEIHPYTLATDPELLPTS